MKLYEMSNLEKYSLETTFFVVIPDSLEPPQFLNGERRDIYDVLSLLLIKKHPLKDTQSFHPCNNSAA